MLFLRKHLSGGTLIDVGSNVGSVTLLLADTIEDAILFEPNPLAAARARENLARNQLDFKVYEFALSDINGEIRFESHGAVDVGGHVSVKAPSGDAATRVVHASLLMSFCTGMAIRTFPFRGQDRCGGA